MYFKCTITLTGNEELISQLALRQKIVITSRNTVNNDYINCTNSGGIRERLVLRSGVQPGCDTRPSPALCERDTKGSLLLGMAGCGLCLRKLPAGQQLLAPVLLKRRN